MLSPQIKIIIICLLSSLICQAKKTVLVTAFEPFGGSDINWSANVAQRVQAQLSAADIEVKICTLPVVYDESAQKAKECYENMDPKPDLVTSFGEGDCNIRLETAAHNHDSTPGYPDNNGTIRTGSAIQAGGPDKVAFKSFVMSLYCSADQKTQKSIIVSESPGGFVCNNTAYSLGTFFEKLKIPYSFIHVPSHNCARDGSPDELPQMAGDELARILKSTLLLDENKFTGEHQKICNLLPTSLTELEQFKKIVAAAQNGTLQKCAEDFLAKLKERLVLWKPKHSTF